MHRTLITDDPTIDRSRYLFEQSPWTAQWIAHPDHRGPEPVVIAYRRRFRLDRTARARIHVTADERYELFVDGVRVGRGSERGDPENWFYETYDLELSAGEHVIVARTWWVGPETPSAYAQFSVRPALFVMAEGEHHDLLSTGVAAWECKRLGGYRFVPPDLPRTFIVVGPKLHIDGGKFDWDHQAGGGDAWRSVANVGRAGVASAGAETPRHWVLRPAILPPMLDRPVRVGATRHIDIPPAGAASPHPVRSANHIGGEVAAWDAMLREGTPLVIPANTSRRIVIDLQNYYCAYPELRVSRGAGASVRISWAESLYEDPATHVKGNRDQIEGKVFHGVGDEFLPDGGSNRTFETLWWEAGRYIEVQITTAVQPLTIQGLTLRETHYPHEFISRFESADPRLEQITPIALRALEMCSHETYMDCPYYEQLMYVGDTRLEVLTTFATTTDDRLPSKALLMFDLSRRPSGLTQARYPARVLQVIPPFSLWYVGMAHDAMMWRGERCNLMDRMGAVRSILDAYRRQIDDNGLVVAPLGWNTFDWVPNWPAGIPADAHTGINASACFLTAMAMRLGAELEEYAGEPALAARNRATADRVGAAAVSAFWDERRGLYAEDRAHRHFSEHAQCLALIGGSVPEAHRPRMLDGLFTAKDLDRTTIYFTHYYFEVCRLSGRMDAFFERLKLWFGLREQGFRTTVESPEPSRSDCHAWGAHPVFHFYATLLGIRPASPGFATVRIEPQLGPLQWAEGKMVHPRGMIEVDVRKEGDALACQVTLPEGVSGEFVSGDRSRPLSPGRQEVRIRG
jgi:hypothetical protein